MLFLLKLYMDRIVDVNHMLSFTRVYYQWLVEERVFTGSESSLCNLVHDMPSKLPKSFCLYTALQ